MRISDFWDLVTGEFGAAYGRALVHDQVLLGVGFRTGTAALDDGVPPREVWLALCEEMEVPEPRRHGRDTVQSRTR
jgi:hypothetical protein